MISTGTIQCKRCKRPLTSLASKLAGIGPRCAAIEEATGGMTAKQADAARELVADGGIVATSHEGVYRVSSSAGDAVYLTAVTGQCSCPYGLRRLSGTAKTCYHVAAVRLAARPVIRRALRRSRFAKAA